jgi:hypothetical protein
MLGTTDVGYVNKNLQRVVATSDAASNHYNQRLNQMECGKCGEEYFANGSDIWLRKCPNCMGGAKSSEAR